MKEMMKYAHDSLSRHKDIKYVIKGQLWQTDFLRFYHSQTNYNISKECFALAVTIHKGKKSYGFNIDNPRPAALDHSFAAALELIDSLPEDPDFVDIEDDLGKTPELPKTNNITAVPLAAKTDILSRMAEAVKPHNFELYGTFICNHTQNHLINSNGLDKQWTNSPIFFEVKAVHNDSQITVLETFGGENFKRFDEADFRSRLLQKLAYCANEVVDVEPGEYTVVFAPRCVAELAQYLVYGMTAWSLDQRRSYFEGKVGEQVFPAFVTITDDPSDPDVIRFDYSDDGHLYQKLDLVDRGVFKHFMCNKYYSHKTGLENNGNSANCLVVQGGGDDLDAMIAGVEHGLYISSLHYINFINFKETSVTGLTRDGTFLIENGRITKVVNSLRFTDKIVRIFQNIAALENKSYTTPFSQNYEQFGIEAVKSPHAKVLGFNITSSTKTI